MLFLVSIISNYNLPNIVENIIFLMISSRHIEVEWFFCLGSCERRGITCILAIVVSYFVLYNLLVLCLIVLNVIIDFNGGGKEGDFYLWLVGFICYFS